MVAKSWNANVVAIAKIKDSFACFSLKWASIDSNGYPTDERCARNSFVYGGQHVIGSKIE